MKRIVLLLALAVGALVTPALGQTRSKWTLEEAAAWQEGTGWLVGANYGPATAINQLEMWQAETFDLATIDRELQWAEDLGMNSMRFFLHHLLWEQDSAGLLDRMNQFLHVADKHRIRVMFVLFDSVWDPHPRLGKQREPRQGLHNSGWVQSPGADDLMKRHRHPLLEAYTKGVIARFRDDARIICWDIWNEPDNPNDNSYGRNGSRTEPAGKLEMTAELLQKSFAWARAAGPSQPITSACGSRTGPSIRDA